MSLRLTPIAAGLAFLLAILVLPGLAQAQAPEPHQAIQEYTGPATCEMCHANVTNDVIHSAHYTWEGKLDQYSPVAASTAAINWLGMLNEKLDIPGGCGRCHIGSGALPTSPEQVTAEARAGIDCLICHSPIYDTSLRFPVQDASGAWALTQDRTLLAARQGPSGQPLKTACSAIRTWAAGRPSSRIWTSRRRPTSMAKAASPMSIWTRACSASIATPPTAIG